MKCDRCDKEIREPGINPSLELKALGLYPTVNMSLGTFPTTISFPSGGIGIDLGSANVVVNETDVTTVPNGWLLPKALHKLPGRPINAYLELVSVAVRVSIATAVAAAFSIVLFFEDTDGRRHALGSYTNTPQEGSFNCIPVPIIIAAHMQEKPLNLGRFVVNGLYTIGASSGVTMLIYPNYNLLYGAPNT